MASLKDENAADGAAKMSNQDATAGATAGTTAPTSSGSSSNYQACHAALDTAELLETTILHLPPLNIFVVQRVSRNWRDAIATSTKVRQRMFLRPVTDNERWILKGVPDTTSDIDEQPALRDVELVTAFLPSKRQSPSSNSEPALKEQIYPAWIPAKPCPLLLRSTAFENAADRVYQCGHESGFEMDMTRFMGASGSWKDMQLTNPPSKRLRVHSDIQLKALPRATISARIMVENGETLTLADVQDSILGGVQDFVYLQGHSRGDDDVWDTSFEEKCTLAEFVSRQGLSYLDGDSFESCHTCFDFGDVVLATEDECEQVRGKGLKAGY